MNLPGGFIGAARAGDAAPDPRIAPDRSSASASSFPLPARIRYVSFTCNHSVIFDLSFVGQDHEMATKWPYNWSPGLILAAFRTIFLAWPVGTGLGAKLGRRMAEEG